MRSDQVLLFVNAENLNGHWLGKLPGQEKHTKIILILFKRMPKMKFVAHIVIMV